MSRERRASRERRERREDSRERVLRRSVSREAVIVSDPRRERGRSVARERRDEVDSKGRKVVVRVREASRERRTSGTPSAKQVRRTVYSRQPEEFHVTTVSGDLNLRVHGYQDVTEEGDEVVEVERGTDYHLVPGKETTYYTTTELDDVDDDHVDLYSQPLGPDYTTRTITSRAPRTYVRIQTETPAYGSRPPIARRAFTPSSRMRSSSPGGVRYAEVQETIKRDPSHASYTPEAAAAPDMYATTYSRSFTPNTPTHKPTASGT